MTRSPRIAGEILILSDRYLTIRYTTCMNEINSAPDHRDRLALRQVRVRLQQATNGIPHGGWHVQHQTRQQQQQQQ